MKSKEIWGFIAKYYPKYDTSEEIARNRDLLKLMEEEFEDGDSASKLLQTYEWPDVKNPFIEQDYIESCKAIYEKSIEGYLESLKKGKYFILGEDACGVCSETDFSKLYQVKKLAKAISKMGSMVAYEALTDPCVVLEDYDGWRAYEEITEEEYNMISNAIKPIGK